MINMKRLKVAIWEASLCFILAGVIVVFAVVIFFVFKTLFKYSQILGFVWIGVVMFLFLVILLYSLYALED